MHPMDLNWAAPDWPLADHLHDVFSTYMVAGAAKYGMHLAHCIGWSWFGINRGLVTVIQMTIPADVVHTNVGSRYHAVVL